MAKEFKLDSLDWLVYNYLKDNNYRWVSKEELLWEIKPLTGLKIGSHDICSRLNHIRIRLNHARHLGLISHLVLLDNNKFKVAESKEEIETYCKRDYDNGINLLVRYYENIGAIKEDGQGKLIDCKGNVITEESLAKRFNDVFGYDNI